MFIVSSSLEYGYGTFIGVRKWGFSPYNTPKSELIIGWDLWQFLGFSLGENPLSIPSLKSLKARTSMDTRQTTADIATSVFSEVVTQKFACF